MPLKGEFVPHTHDAARRRAAGALLGIRPNALPRTSTGLPALDQTQPHQQCFQAALFTCIASSGENPHAWEHPTKPALASIGRYLNRIIPHPDRVDVHTNTPPAGSPRASCR
jgi:hypothetical protein